MEFQGFTLDKFQEDAAAAVDRQNSVLVSSPTGSGKTLIADYIIDKYVAKGKRIIYTAPIKALSNQKFKDFTRQYGDDKIGLITGDIVLNPTAQVLIMTTEVYRNMAIIKDPVLDDVVYCIMDEIHFISDEERGYIWEESIIFSPAHIRFLFLSATIPNSIEFASWVESIKSHKVEVIIHHVRPVPLERKFYDSVLGLTTLEKIRQAKELDNYPDYSQARRGRHRRHKVPAPDFKELVLELRASGQLPCIYFVFSRARTQEYAVEISKKKSFLDGAAQKRIAEEITREFTKVNDDVLALRSTKALRQCLPRGVAFHHAGMLPDMKHIVEELFAKGLIKVLFATETFAVGINMPAKTVCFDSLRKFTNTGFRYLTSKEYFQISGRAGRRGIDKKGLSIAMIFRNSAEINRIAEFTKADTLPLKSQFRITFNTVLNMIHLHSEEEVQKILAMNFFTYQQLKGPKNSVRVLASIRARYTKLIKILTRLGYITADHELTELGIFASKIFSDELEVSQIFKGGINLDLDEYSIILLIMALVYEGRRGVRFYNTFGSQKVNNLIKKISSHPVLRKSKWHLNIDRMTAIVYPLYNRKRFLEILDNTNMTEGDLIRILMRVIDKLEQIDRAIVDDHEMLQKIRNCKHMLKDCLEGIQMF